MPHEVQTAKTAAAGLHLALQFEDQLGTKRPVNLLGDVGAIEMP